MPRTVTLRERERMTLSSPAKVRSRTHEAGSVATLAFVILLIALIARLVFAIWERYDGTPTYDEIAALGEAYWPMNVLVFGPAWALGFFAQGILAWRLADGRGRLTTFVGACLLVVGGVLFALVATAHALPYDWAANHGILAADLGRVVVDEFSGSGTVLLLPYILGAQALIALGALVTAIGAWVSRTVPVWLVGAVGVLLVAFFVVPRELGSAVDWLLSSLQLAMWAVLGWFGWRRGRADG